MRKYALLVDGGFLAKKLHARYRGFPTVVQVLQECERVKASPALAGCELLRIYYYDAPPATGILDNPVDGTRLNLGRTPQYERARALHDALELTPDFALRFGEVAVRGHRMNGRAIKAVVTRGGAIQASDIQPNMEQKGVDLRIGLDIARLSLGHLVDVIAIVTGDSDLIPAFKFARREGLRVYLDHLRAPVKRELKVHADLVL